MATAAVNLAATADDSKTINVIADRAVTLAKMMGVRYSKTEAAMDVTAAHLNDHPLDLVRLAAANDFDFAHDVFGIRKHLDRTTDKLGGCFVPRFAA